MTLMNIKSQWTNKTYASGCTILLTSFLLISTDLHRSDQQEATRDNPRFVLGLAGPMKNPYKLAHSNVRGPTWISSTQGPLVPLEERNSVILGGYPGWRLYNAVTPHPLFLHSVFLLMWPPVLWWVKSCEIRTKVHDYFYEGNMSFLFLGYTSLKIVLSIFIGKSSGNRFAALWQYDNFITPKSPLYIRKRRENQLPLFYSIYQH